MSEKNRKRRRSRVPSFLVRRDEGDFGPFSEKELKAAIRSRKIDLGTSVQEVGSDSWQPAGSFTLFRDHYAHCQQAWETEELDRELEDEERKLRQMDRVKGGAGRLIVLGLVVLAGVGSWLVYRMMHAEPTGIAAVVSIDDVPILPGVPATVISPPAFKVTPPTKVKRGLELPFYDTRGVAASESAEAGDMNFDFDGEAKGIDRAALHRIKGQMQKRIAGCARLAVKAGARFRRVNASYRVRPGKLTDVTIARPAFAHKGFVACVRRRAAAAKVPHFEGVAERVEHSVTLEYP